MNSTSENDDAIEMTPPALLWLHEFEQSNSHLSQPRLWRELHARAKSRGMPSVKGLEWPGPVYVPSQLMNYAIQKGTIIFPKRWSDSIPSELQGRMLSLLTAWEKDRGIYSFTKTSAELVSQCGVSSSLKASIFNGLPASAIYIDLLNFHPDIDSLSINEEIPWGFFVGVDQPSPGKLDLVMAMDRYTHLDVQVIPLQGKTMDELAINMLLRARAKTTDARAWAEAQIRDTQDLWQLALSATLMTCINQHRMKPINTNSQNCISDVRKAWSRWEVGSGIDEQIIAERSRRGEQSMLVGQWCQPTGNESIRLQFSAGCQLNWNDLERRHGSNLDSQIDPKA